MTDLKWGFVDSVMSQLHRDDPTYIRQKAVNWLALLTVNGVPLRDVLAETASGLDDDIHGVGVILRDYDMSVAVLRALAGGDDD